MISVGLTEVESTTVNNTPVQFIFEIKVLQLIFSMTFQFLLKFMCNSLALTEQNSASFEFYVNSNGYCPLKPCSYLGIFSDIS